MSAAGREAIEAAYADEFTSSPDASISLKVESLTFVTPEVIDALRFSNKKRTRQITSSGSASWP